METDAQTNEQKEVEKAQTTEKFNDLIRKHEAASRSDDICVPALFTYSVPEDKNANDYEEKRKTRLAELENTCNSGPSNLCRAPSVWKGSKEKEEHDRKWAEDKLKLLRAERNSLKEGNPGEAKKLNYRMKLHEKCRPVPDSKRKELEKTGSSPNNSKILKTASVEAKLPLSIGDKS